MEFEVFETVIIRRWLRYLLIHENLTENETLEINELIEKIDEHISIDDLI